MTENCTGITIMEGERERGFEGGKYGGKEREINRHIPLSLHSLHCAQYWLQSIIKDNYLSKV